MQEVGGSIPPSSTNPRTDSQLSPSSRGLGHRPFTAVTGVRIPLGTPLNSVAYSESGGQAVRIYTESSVRFVARNLVLRSQAGFHDHQDHPQLATGRPLDRH